MTENIELRFVVVTDGHWGQEAEIDGETRTYQEVHEDALNRIEQIHAEREIDFVVNNGDIVHDDETLHSEVKANFFDELPTGVDWYVVFGNHDWATDDEWEDVYNQPKQHTFEYGEYGFIITETGEPRTDDWYCADADWLENQIDGFSDKEDVFVFNHIAPDDDWDYTGVNCPDVRSQFQRDEVKAVLLGHNHEENTVQTHDGVQYAYASRVGGYEPTQGAIDLGLRIVDIDE